jgi:hypothetical protein
VIVNDLNDAHPTWIARYEARMALGALRSDDPRQDAALALCHETDAAWIAAGSPRPY